jgi:hypothetical protein
MLRPLRNPKATVAPPERIRFRHNVNSLSFRHGKHSCKRVATRIFFNNAYGFLGLRFWPARLAFYMKGAHVVSLQTPERDFAHVWVITAKPLLIFPIMSGG